MSNFAEVSGNNATQEVTIGAYDGFDENLANAFLLVLRGFDFTHEWQQDAFSFMLAQGMAMLTMFDTVEYWAASAVAAEDMFDGLHFAQFVENESGWGMMSSDYAPVHFSLVPDVEIVTIGYSPEYAA